MNYQNKINIGNTLNIFCFVVCSLVSVPLIIAGRLDLGVKVGLLIACGFVLAAVFLLTRRKKLSDRIRQIIYSLSHLSLIMIACFASQSAEDVFILFAVSHLLIAALYDGAFLKRHFVGTEIFFVALYFLTPTKIELDYQPVNYVGGMICIAIMDMILFNMIRATIAREEDIVENNRSMDDLLRVVEAKCEEAQAATRSKNFFLSNMSHEIRTPINAIMGMNEMIMRESHEEQVLSYARDVQAAGSILLSLVNDIIDYSKMESGIVELQHNSFDVRSVLNDLVNVFAIRCQENGLELKLDIDNSLPHVLEGDEVHLRQILSNLFAHSARSMEESGVIEFGLDYEQLDDFVIELRINVSHTAREEMIKSFISIIENEEGSTAAIQDHHLTAEEFGLSITARLIEMLGGKLFVETPGNNCIRYSFGIRLEVQNWEGIGDFQNAYKKFREKTEKYRESFYAPDAKVLVVDDVRMNLTVFQNLLVRTGMQIDTAESGKEALEKARRNAYDLFVFDHMMPEMDGIEVLHRLRKDPYCKNRTNPVLVLTANAVVGAREEYLKEGFSDYLTKPIDPVRLEAAIRKFLPEELLLPLPEQEEEQASGEESFISKAKSIAGLDTEAALGYTGSEETLEMVIQEFYTTIASRAETIETHFTEHNTKEYTVQVHALKSSARLIGANELSRLAAEMEQAGNADDWDAINANTASLLEQYRGYAVTLGKLLGEDETAEDTREEIPTDMLLEAIAVMKEGAECFDYDLISSVTEQLDEYKMPEGFAEAYKKLKLLMSEVEMEGIKELLSAEYAL